MTVSPEHTPDKAIHLLWTGGWDSTFRLLQLLLIQKKTVQPYYVIDSARQSTEAEIRARRTIKDHLFEKHAYTRDLLLPTRFRELSDIKPNAELTQAYKGILNRCYIGSQYEWLAKFCHEADIDAMELSIHRDDMAHLALEPFVVAPGPKKDSPCKVDQAFRDTDEYALFRFFRFPIFNDSKLDMKAIAHDEGFADIMGLTWFCHNPRPDSRPCGVCNPCIYTIEEGMGGRLPLASRLRYHLRVRARIQRFFREHPALAEWLRQAKRRIIRGKS